MSEDHPSTSIQQTPIAIIGIGCRLPGGANSPAEFWRLLTDGVDAISEVESDRWSVRKFGTTDPRRNGHIYSRWGGFVKDPDLFDAQFFGISPREASRMDPQQRMMLEVSYEALEDAGIPLHRVAGSNTGVFVGVSSYDYGALQGQPTERQLINGYNNLGGALSIVAARVSYAFDLKGPNLSVDTACSSALVAMHLACQSIWNRESELALVGGVNYLLSNSLTMGFCRASMLSVDGRCKPFDSRANGYVRAEGCGVVVLKPLDQALADGDAIYAVVRATGVNQDGHSASIAVPNGDAQADLLRSVYSRAGIDPAGVQYVEAHGTGTPVGDPLEVNAIGEVLGVNRPADRPCLIGSAKSNVGHLEAGAGVVGVIKAALSLKHGQIPPTLHFLEPNPDIPFDDLNLRVVSRLEPWPDTASAPRTAGVNSFGFGGTNAHVVLQQAPQAVRSHAEAAAADGASLLVLSARSQSALRAMAHAYKAFLSDERNEASLPAICAAAALRRSHHDYRLALSASSREEMASHLDAFAAGEKRTTMSTGHRMAAATPKVAFVFSGMGQQRFAMGRELLATEPVFRRTVEEIDAHFRPLAGWSIVDELNADESVSRIQETRVAQPSIFALQVGLAALWQSWGITPRCLAGHSVGEVAAAYVAGVYTLQDAVKIIYHRSRLQHTTEGQGRMLAVGVSADEASQLIAGREAFVSIAALNGPTSITLSGAVPALEEIDAILRAKGAFSRFLQVEVPYHSPAMDAIHEELLASLQGIVPRRASIPLVSTALGKPVEGPELDGDYWWQNVRQPVLFLSAMQHVADEGCNVALEIGAHPVLSTSITQCLSAAAPQAVTLHSLKRGELERVTLLGGLGRLHTLGAQIDWRGVHPITDSSSRVALPGYAWQHERFWAESEDSRRYRTGTNWHSLLGQPLSTAMRTWSAQVDASLPAYLGDHRLQGAVVFPGAGYVEMALTAARSSLGGSSLIVEDLDLIKALVLRDGTPTDVQLTLQDDDTSFQISSRTGEGDAAWTTHVRGNLRTNTTPAARRTVSIDQLRSHCPTEIPIGELYDRLAETGLEFGPQFRNIQRVWTNGHEAVAQIELVSGEVPADDVFYPPLLDACFQVFACAVHGKLDGLFLPRFVKQMVVHASPGRALWAHARVVKNADRLVEVDIDVYSHDGEFIAGVSGLQCRLVGRRKGATVEKADNFQYRYRWIAQPLGVDGVAAASSTDDLRVSLQKSCQQAPGDREAAAKHRDVTAQLNSLMAQWIAETRDGGNAGEPSAEERWRSMLRRYPAYLAELTILRQAALGAELNANAVDHLLIDAPTTKAAHRMLASARAAVLDGLVTSGAPRILDMGPANEIEAAGSYDLVVLPDGPDVAAGESRVQQAFHRLRPGGLLVGSAASHIPDWLNVCFGSAWQARSNAVEWLTSAGFEDIATLASEDDGPVAFLARRPAETAGAMSTEPVTDHDPNLAPSGSWLIFSDGSTLSEKLARRLRHRGLVPVLVAPGASLDLSDTRRLQIRPENPDDMQTAIERALAGDTPCHGIVHMWSLLMPEAPLTTVASLDAAQKMGATSVLHLAQSLRRMSLAETPALHVVTRGTQRAGTEDVISVAALPVWGLGRVLMNEFPGLKTRLIDLSPEPSDDEVTALLGELTSTDGEDEVALRSAVRYVHRLEPSSATAHAATASETSSSHAVHLTVGTPGVLDSLVFESSRRKQPGPGQVEIEVRSAGLNFKDVAKAMGLLGDVTLEGTASGRGLGLECSGVVSRVGDGVTTVRPGDEVVGFASVALGTHAIADARLIGRKPATWSHDDAATLVTVAMTAHYALNHLGRLARGERVLIHAGAGGVGLAAIQLAQRAGAEIFATAGSPDKRSMLRALGVHHVMDSRSLSFADEIMAITGRRGVDVVLNSLTGEAIRKSLAVLAPFGRFIEIGKRDIEQNAKLGLRPFQDNLSFCSVDLDRLCVERPESASRLCAEVLDFVKDGTLAPLPYRVFPAVRAVDAFRHMAKAKHVGKIVISMDGASALAPPPAGELVLRDDATYLVTGGLSGFGLSTAQWLVRQGARHIVLAGRSGASNDVARQALAEMRAAGIDVVVARLDVTIEPDVRRILRDIEGAMPPLRGIVHCAMVLDDGITANLDAERMRVVAAPKVLGAWNLHTQTLSTNLDFFVMYSSFASMFGNPGQGNYAAANAFLDGLADFRRSLGLPALTVNWGAIADVGVVARSGNLQDHFGRLGIEPLRSDTALSILGGLMQNGGGQIAVFPPSDWAKLSRVFPAVMSPRFSRLMNGSESRDGEVAGGDVNLRTRIINAASEDRLDLVAGHLRTALASVLGTSPDRLNAEQPLHEMGIDSLMSAEVVVRIQSDVGVDVPPMRFMEGISLSGLATFIVNEVTRGLMPEAQPA